MRKQRKRTGGRRPLALLLALIGLTGCAGTDAQQASYLDDYEQGRYSRASVEAIKVVRNPAATDRDVARLTAGLSAHALGRNDEAIVWLRPLTTNPDDRVAGKSLATLGLIAMEEGEHQSAAKSLSRAAGKLHGDDSARAAMFAGDSYASLGSADAARLQYRLAMSAAKAPSLRQEVAMRLGEGFTLQVGAFASRTNAERTKRQLESNRSLASLGDPVVRRRTDNRGGQLYLVQVGHFATQRDAKAAQLRTGINGIVTIASASDVAG